MRSFQAVCRFSLLVAFLTAIGSSARSQQILEIFDDPLTTYLPSGTTVVNGVRPQHTQRGTNIDGSWRASPGLAMQIAGNASENAWTGKQTDGPMRIDVGGYAPMEVDISLPTTGLAWVIGRTFNSLQQNSGGSSISSNGPQGINWMNTSMPEIVLHQHVSDDGKDVLYLVYGADRYAEYRRWMPSPLTASDQFNGVNGATGAFDYADNGGAADTYTLTDQVGNQFVFFGFDGASGVAAGQFWKMTDPAGNVAYVGHATNSGTAISSGYDANCGGIKLAYDASDNRYTYAYTQLNSVWRVTQVKAEVKDSGTWGGSPVNVRTAVQVDYGYYGTGDSNGDAGNLKTVTVTTRLNDDEGITQTKTKLYTYWVGAYDATGTPRTNPGYPNSIKLVVDNEGCRRYDLDVDTVLDGDYIGASTASLLSYSSAYFEYDSSRRIDRATHHGQCGCGGGASGEHHYSYGTNGSFTPATGYQQLWAKRTIIEHPDGSYLTQLFDETSQGLARVISDSDPASASNFWVTDVVRDTSGLVTEIDTPESVHSYTHSTGATVVPLYSDTTPLVPGLVWTYVRDTGTPTAGFVLDRYFQLGRSAVNAYYDSSQTWSTTSQAVGNVTVYRPLVDDSTRYPNESTGTTGAQTTTHTYTTYTADSKPLSIRKVTTTTPVVSNTNNGPNTSLVSYSHITREGRVDFEKKTDATVVYHEFENGKQKIIKQDADTGGLTLPVVSGSTPDTDFASAGTELDKTTTKTISKLGVELDVATPTGVTNSILRTKLADERQVTVEFPDSGSGTYYGPGRITVYNQAGKVEMTGVIAYSSDSTSTALSGHVNEIYADPITAISVGTLSQMSVNIYDNSGTEVVEERRYFLIPGSGAGTEGTHYDATRYAYDSMGRRVRTKDPSGTIRRTAFDIRGQVSDSYIGTNDYSFPSGESSGPDNMVKTEHVDYDGGSAGKNGHVTQRTLYVEGSTTGQRITTYLHDWRGRQVVELPPSAPYTVTKLDNLGRAIAVGQYSSSSGLSATTDPTSIDTNRMALSETLYDELGRAWKTIRHKIDPADGSDDDTLVSESWFDDAGRLIKVDGSELKKLRYDRVGRVIDEYILAVDNDSTYADADDVTGDIVLEQHVTRYSQARGNVILRMNVSRWHTDHNTTSPSYSETTGALYPDAEAGENAITLSSVIGRPQITSYWYDRTNRLKNQVNFGTSSGSSFTRNTSDPTTSTALEPLTITIYNTDGTVDTVENPDDIVTKYVYDAMGRRTKEIRNYNAGVNSGNPSGTDDNVTVRYEYVNGLRTKLVADVPSPGTDQETVYTYGTTKGVSAGDSKIATGHLLQKVTYPDSSSGTDNVTSAYNAQGQEIWKKDQAGNIYEMDFDTRGRQTQRRVTTLAGGFDGAVRRIGTTFDSLGRNQLVTQYDNATVGSGSVTDEVKYTYDGWGNLTFFEQDRDSAVGAGGSVNDYEVQYQWAKATTGRNTIRKTKMFLPSGDRIGYVYNSTGGSHDSEVSRVTELQDDSRVVLARYAYNGVGHVVGTEYPEPQVMWNQYSGSGSSPTYPDLDEFNRVVKSRWTKDLSTDVDFYHVELTYDRNSNIVTAEDGVHTGFDVLYTMDDIDRLTEAKEGTLAWSGVPPTASISSPTRDQQWTLSQTGNWDVNKVDLNGDLDFADTDEENDTRAHNAVNEIGTRNSGGISLAYDAAGNMTDDGVDYEYEWDAFYRLRKVKNQSSALVAEYRYNGLGFRIAEHADMDTDGDVDGSDVWFYDAFDERWRQVALFRSSDTTPKEEFVAHQAGLGGHGGSSYIDLVALRQKDANTAWASATDGVQEERVYYCQNLRADVSALITSSGQMLEWGKYSAYGVAFGIPAGDSNSDGDCDSADQATIVAWTTGYDARCDINLDGVIDSGDTAIAPVGETLGLTQASRIAVANKRSVNGLSLGVIGQIESRNRSILPHLGAWMSRDPLGYHSSASVYEALDSLPTMNSDPMGLAAARCPGAGKYSWDHECDPGRHFFTNCMDFIRESSAKTHANYLAARAYARCASTARCPQGCGLKLAPLGLSYASPPPCACEDTWYGVYVVRDFPRYSEGYLCECEDITILATLRNHDSPAEPAAFALRALSQD